MTQLELIQDNEAEDQWVQRKEAAKILGVHQQNVAQTASRYKIPTRIKHNGYTLYLKPALEKASVIINASRQRRREAAPGAKWTAFQQAVKAGTAVE